MYNYARKPVNYLAGPYTHKDKAIMDEREVLHSKAANALKQAGLIVYAPIPETTALAKLGGMVETNWAFWRDHDLNMLDRCDKLLVLMIPGWKESVGVRGEVKFALTKGMPVEFLAADLSYTLV